jgi:NAD(P)-binding Rossmann-like domain
VSRVEDVDAVVLGASTRGMVATYMLSALGFRAVLIEKGPDLGGGDGSFRLADGTWFDFGMHVLDEMRSELATRLFLHVLDGRVHRVRLKRGLVLRNCIMPYAPQPAEMPSELRAMLPGEALTDEIADQLPTRERLARHYGAAFADFIFDEVLVSFPSEHRHLAFGVDEAELLVNIYPWFFPRAQRKARQGDASRAFHDKLRMGIDQYVLYPRGGGFVEFSRGLARRCDRDRIEILTAAKDLEVMADAGAHRIERVRVGERTFRAARYFWAGSWPELCGLIGLPCQNPATDRIVLGSFRLNRPANTAFHELLVGDPRHAINRIHFPGAFRESDDPLMQVEFAFPNTASRSLEPQRWRDSWIESLRALDLLDAEHRVELFDFKTRPLHFNGFGMEGERLRDADPTVRKSTSNVYPVVPSMANLNLNAHLPQDVAFVAGALARDPIYSPAARTNEERP